MLYNLLHKISHPLLLLLFRLKVKGIENIPREGGVLICANHLSHLDPVILGSALPRPAYYLAHSGLFRNSLFGRFISILHAFPIPRDGFFRSAFKKVEDLLNRGEVVVFYPEGTRSKDGRLGPAKAGVGMLVSKMKGIPVIPAKIIGTNRALPVGGLFIRPYSIEVRFGKPLYFETLSLLGKEIYQEIADTIMAKIGEL